MYWQPACVKNSADFNHKSSTIIIWPVEETGANSVNPSTNPNIIAFKISKKSILIHSPYIQLGFFTFFTEKENEEYNDSNSDNGISNIRINTDKVRNGSPIFS